MNGRVGTMLAIAGAVIAYVWVRCLSLDLFVTTDEPFWLGRSANFYRALVAQDFVHTYQMAHPGVLTMWAGAMAHLWSFPEYGREVTSNLDHVYGIDAVVRDLNHDPMELLIAARRVKILLQGGFFALSLIFLRNLFGTQAMLIAGLLIAFDPFVSGLDSLLHVDGLFAIAILTALLAIVAAERTRPEAMWPWIGAGCLAACAWMTRATGLVLVPIVGLLAGSHAVAHIRHRRCGSLRAALESPAFTLMLWATGAIGMSLLLLPALWVEPFGTMQQVWDWSITAARDGHERPTFFLGQIHSGDPGWLFYPVTLIWRLTPVALAGSMALIVSARRAWKHHLLSREDLRSLAILVGFSLLYVGGMTLGAKKFDRYILPVYLVVDILAAIGIVIASRWVACRLRGSVPALGTVMVAALAATQVIALATSLPYRIDYTNPLLGGLGRAQHAIQIGWGEGGAEAIQFVARNAAGKEVTVQTSSVAPVFSYASPPNVTFDNFGLGTPAGWYETDYFIVGIQEWQRDLSPSYPMMQAYDPAHTVIIDGVPFFRIYAPRALPLPDHLRGETGCSATFGDGIELMQIIGRDDTIDFYWLTAGTVPADLEVIVTLANDGPTDNGNITWSTHLSAEAQGYMSRSTIPNPRTADSPPLSSSTITIQMVDAQTGQVLPAHTESSGEEHDTFQTQSECYSTS